MFWRILATFKNWKNQNNQDGETKMAGVLKPDVVSSHMTSSARFASLVGNIFGRTISLPRFVVIASIFLELKVGCRISPSPPLLVPEDRRPEKKARSE